MTENNDLDLSKPARRRLGCLPRLLIFVLFIGACYWILLAPIPGRNGDQTEDTATPAVPSEQVLVEGEINPTQQTALDELAVESGGQVDALAQHGQIQYLTINVPIPDTVAVSAREKAQYFLSHNVEIFEIRELTQTIRYDSAQTDDLGNTYVRFTQQYQGIPVNGSGIVIGISKDGTVFSVNANYVPNLNIDIDPSIRSVHAEGIALDDMNSDGGTLAGSTTLEIYASELSEGNTEVIPARLAWFVTVGSELTEEFWLYIIDAENGAILNQVDLILRAGGQLDLEIWEKDSAGTKYILVMNETGNYQDRSPSGYAENALGHAWEIYRYYYDNFGRDSFDDKGGKLVIRVNSGNCDNTAYLSPKQPFILKFDQFIYFCKDFTIPQDTMAHEYTHAVIESTAKLGNSGEPRELNEAFADIFAAFASKDDSPWQINWPRGNGILRDLASPQQGFQSDYPIRYEDRYCDQKEPSCIKKCPEKMGEYEESYSDCGHVNSLVFSHAAYLMSREADPVNGIPREKLQYLYYYAITSGQIQSKTNQKQAARVIANSCEKIVDNEQNELFEDIPLPSPFIKEDCEQVNKAFVEVGLRAPSILPQDNPQIPVPQLPEMPDLLKLLNELRENLRKALDDLLGKWSPFKLWNQIQEEINKIRNNYWVKLLECINNSDQECVNKYITDLINATIEMLVNTLCNFCSTLLIAPVVGIAVYRKKRKN